MFIFDTLIQINLQFKKYYMEKIYFYKRDVILQTYLNQEDIYDRLVQCTEKIDLHTFHLRFPKSDKTFYGIINIDNFYIISNLKYYQNSFNPFIKGKIYAAGNINKIEIKFSMYKFISFMIYLQLTFLSLVFIAIIFTSRSFTELLEGLFPTLMMLMVISSLSLWGFNNEANYAVRVLKKQLEALS